MLLNERESINYADLWFNTKSGRHDTQHNVTEHIDIQHNDTQHNN